ncbi:MAG: flagellar export protein FliJ [Dehalococcoidia bacterium]|nr:MAG: flagellar export protein FliJ [Dehalococcoidia bacterium]
MAHPFRLQRLLDYRRRLEDGQALALAEATAEECRVRNAIAMLERQREEQTAALGTLLGGGVFGAEEYSRRAAFLDAAARALEVEAEALKAAAAHVVESRQALVEALKDRRVLERLRDRQAEAAGVEDGRREARETDDMVTARRQRAQRT